MTATEPDWLRLPDAPPIPGLRFRRYGGPADLPAMAEVRNAAWRVNGMTEVLTADQLRIRLDHQTHIDPTQDVILAFVDDRLVATSEIEWSDTSDGQRHYLSLGLSLIHI